MCFSGESWRAWVKWLKRLKKTNPYVPVWFTSEVNWKVTMLNLYLLSVEVSIRVVATSFYTSWRFQIQWVLVIIEISFWKFPWTTNSANAGIPVGAGSRYCIDLLEVVPDFMGLPASSEDLQSMAGSDFQFAPPTSCYIREVFCGAGWSMEWATGLSVPQNTSQMLQTWTRSSFWLGPRDMVWICR